MFLSFSKAVLYLLTHTDVLAPSRLCVTFISNQPLAPPILNRQVGVRLDARFVRIVVSTFRLRSNSSGRLLRLFGPVFLDLDGVWPIFQNTIAP